MSATPPRVPWFADLSPRQFFVIVGSFWIYVTISDLLYAYGMREGVAGAGGVSLFAPWNARLLQHLILLPCLVTSFWASLRVQWRPALTAVPLQLLLAGGFAALAYPAMLASSLAMDRSHWSAPGMERWAEHSLWNASLGSIWLASFVSVLPAYGFGLALVTGLTLYTRFKSAQLRLATLEQEWSAARLAALRMQLSPHALFNLLNTIRGAIDWDPRGAQTMVIQLATLLRQLLKAGAREMAPLADEMHFVGLYLELQQRRFSDRLRVELPDPSLCPPVWVPSLILQPLVENAVVHGLADHAGTVVVQVEISAAANQIVLRVRNTLAAPNSPPAEGVGLKNVRERLSVHFEGRATFTAGLRDGEWHSEICLPDLRENISNADPGEPRSAKWDCRRGSAAEDGLMDVIIVDDEPAGRRVLRKCCEAEQDLNIVGEYGDPELALVAIRGLKPDVVFLDIHMEPLDGVALVRALAPQPHPAVVFVTAYDSHAIDAFELCAADYLLKPFDDDRFRKTLVRLRARQAAAASGAHSALLAEMLAQLERGPRQPGGERPRLLAEFNGRFQIIDPSRVELLEADRNYVALRVGAERFHTRSTLASAEQALASQPLLRISRSCLVNVNFVREVNRTLRGDFIFTMAGGATVTSSEGFRLKVRDYLISLKLSPV